LRRVQARSFSFGSTGKVLSRHSSIRLPAPPEPRELIHRTARNAAARMRNVRNRVKQFASARIRCSGRKRSPASSPHGRQNTATRPPGARCVVGLSRSKPSPFNYFNRGNQRTASAESANQLASQVPQGGSRTVIGNPATHRPCIGCACCPLPHGACCVCEVPATGRAPAPAASPQPANCEAIARQSQAPPCRLFPTGSVLSYLNGKERIPPRSKLRSLGRPAAPPHPPANLESWAERGQ